MAAHQRRPYVLHVTATTTGGVADTVLSHVREQLGRGWGVCVACPSTGWLGYSVRQAGGDVVWFDLAPSPSLTRSVTTGEVARLARVVRRLRPDLLHLHGASAALTGRWAVRGRVPTVVEAGDWLTGTGGGLRRRLRTQAERLAVAWTDELVCTCPREVGLLRELGIAVPALVVPRGVAVERFPVVDGVERRRVRRGLGIDDRPTVVSTGRLVPEKGHRLLLEAWSRLQRHHRDAQLVIVGDGPERAALAAAATGRVVFTGWRTDVAAWLAAADLTAFPSPRPPYAGGALAGPLEAMASGRSVVGSWFEGEDELVPYDCGALVPAGDVGKLTQALDVRLESPEIADDEGKHGWKYVAAHRDLAEGSRRVATMSLRLMAARRR